MRAFIIMCVILLMSPIALATIYQKKNADGSLSFSDQASPGSKPVKLGQPNVFSGNKQMKNEGISPEEILTPTNKNQAPVLRIQPKEKQEQENKEQPAVVGYKTMKIMSPHNEQTFHNQRNLTVNISLVPGLQKGDRIQLKVDGVSYGSPVTSTSISLYNLDRGSHTLAVEVINKQGRVMITSPSITIYVHYAHLGNQG